MTEDAFRPARTPRAHDLVYLPDRSALSAVDGSALSADAADAAAWSGGDDPVGVWVVVRRGRAGPGEVPVGIRGPARSARFAAAVLRSGIGCVVEPWGVPLPPEARPGGIAPAWDGLESFRAQAATLGARRWGPSGSVAFELVSGRPTVSRASDLDLVVDAPAPLPTAEVEELLRLADAAPCHVDIQVITPAGGFALREWATARGGRIALRTEDGVRSTVDPWAGDP